MNRSTLALVLSLALVFVSGAFVGGFAYRLLKAESTEATVQRPGPEEYRKRFVEMLRERLSLSDGQLVELNAILDRTHERFVALEDEVWKPQKHEIIEQQAAEINAILSDEQRAEYAKVRAERAERRKNRSKESDSSSGMRHR